MEPFSNAVATLGLRHVLEDGLSALRGQILDKERRDFVLKDLTGLLGRAARGVEITDAQKSHLVVDKGDVSAFEAFSLFFRYLNDVYSAALSNKIGSAYQTLSRLAEHQTIESGANAEAIEFFSRLLDRLNRDETYGAQREPEAIRLA